MFRTGSEKRDRLLLNRGSLEACPPELRQSLAYILHLRSHWKPEGRAKLIVPTSWMEFLVFANGKCRTERCPFGSVRFENVAEARLVMPDEELPQDVVSQFLTNVGMESGCLATLVSRAFEGIPRTSPRSDVPTMGLARSQSTPRRIDFALVSGADDALAKNDTRCLLLGIKEPTKMQQPPFESVDSRSGHGPLGTLARIPEELTSHGQFHLTLLTKLIQGGAVETVTESFPEWLVLFGLLYDAHHVRIIACIPRPPKSDVTDCAAYIVDQFSLRPGSVAGVPACELVLEHLRLLVALTTLRRHVLHLSKSLFSTIDPCDGIRRTHSLTCDQHNSDDSESLKRCGSFVSSSEYSTCPSSVHARESSDVPVAECGEESSSCRSLASSFCSTCSSLLESASVSGSFHSEDSRFTDPDSSDYMEPSTTSRSHGSNKSVACSSKLTETKRWEIIAWAREVIPTEHPVKDTYRMVVNHHHPRRQRVADFESSTRR